MGSTIQEGVTRSPEQLRIDRGQDSKLNVCGIFERHFDFHFTHSEKRAARQEMRR